MDVLNAIAKVRFGTAKAQRIQLHKGEKIVVDLLCMEAGQQMEIAGGEWCHYIVTGKAALTSGTETFDLPTGQLASGINESHILSNAGEGRLVILTTGHPG